MKTVRIFTNEMEARIACGKMEAAGFTVFMNGSREYASIVVGGAGEGRYEVQVPDDEAADAEKYFASEEVLAPELMTDSTDDFTDEQIARGALKRAIIYAMMGATFVPFLGIYISIKYAVLFAKLEKRQPSKALWLVAIAAMNVLGLFASYALLGTFKGMF